MHTCNLSTVGVLERSEVQDHSELHEEFKASLCYMQLYPKTEWEAKQLVPSTIPLQNVLKQCQKYFTEVPKKRENIYIQTQ